MKPLQTHGQYDERWIPPKPDRFTIYETSDELWLRPLGFGRMERTLQRMYDVRTGGDMRLAGYCRVDPTERYYIRLTVVPDVDRWDSDISKIEQPRFDEIVLRVQQYDINGQRFACWVVDLPDVEKLLATTWLTFGGDNLRRFVHEIRREMYEVNARAAR